MENQDTIIRDTETQSVSRPLGPRGRRFESCRPDSEIPASLFDLAERTIPAGLPAGLHRKPRKKHVATSIPFQYGTPEYRRAYYLANRERMKTANAAYKKEHPDRAKQYKDNYAKKYPERDRARLIVLQAVRTGRLVKHPCEVCGDPDSEGHHDDYSKPLEVMWLCPQHHADRHRQLREAVELPRFRAKAIRQLESAIAAARGRE